MNFASEYDFQVWCARWLDENLAPWARYTAFPASGATSRQRGAMLKKMGLKPGWPDFQIIARPPKAKAAEFIFIELKIPTGRLSSEQKILHDFLDKSGVKVYTAFTTDQFLDIIYANRLTTTKRGNNG